MIKIFDAAATGDNALAELVSPRGAKPSKPARGRDVYGSSTRFGFELRRGQDEVTLVDLLQRVLSRALCTIWPDGTAPEKPRLAGAAGRPPRVRNLQRS